MAGFDSADDTPEVTNAPCHVDDEIAARVHEAEAEVCIAEAAVATVEARINLLGARIASLRALATRAGLLRSKAEVPALPPRPPVDEAAKAKARRALARSGFVRVLP